MTSLRTPRRTLALAVTMTLASALPLSLPTAASCLPLQLPPADAADTIVLVGTVRSIDGIRTELDVVAWFLGAEPTSTVVVAGGGGDPELITSADWPRAVGEEYVVVATRTTDGTLETVPCQQQAPTPELLSASRATYGDPWSPPTASPKPSPSPAVSDGDGQSASFPPAGADASPEPS